MEFDYPLPERWKWVPLGELADTKGRAIVSGPFGSNISSKFFVEDGIPVIRGNNLTTGSQKFLDTGFVFVTPEKAKELGNVDAVRDDIIFTAAGSLGQVGIIPERTRFPLYIISNKQMRVRLNRDLIEPLFAFHWLSSSPMVEFIQRQNTGSSVPLINLSIVRRLPVPLPPLAEQQAIAAVLGALDDKIELNRRMNTTLESMARALFQSWFVDFDPVRAKLDGRQFEGIDPQIFRMLPDTFETTEDGMVPTGWKFCPLTELYDVSSGLSKPRAEFGFGHPFLTFTNVMNNRFIPQSLTSLVNSSDAERSRCTVERGDVFLTRTSETQEELGMSCAALQSYPQATFNGFTKRLRPKGASPLLPEYAGFYFRSAKFRRDVTAMSSLSTRASLNNEMLSRLKVLLPQAFICEAFANHVSPLLRRMQANDVESKQLATLRDTLLPKLLSGELSVGAATHVLEQA